MNRRLRVFCVEGPGDAIASFNYWLAAGKDNPEVTHVAFSTQIFDVCQQLDVELLMVGAHPRIERVQHGRFVVEHRGDPSLGKRGLHYHLSELIHGLRLIGEILRFRADVVIAASRPYPFLFGVLCLAGIRVVLTLHCVLWPTFGTQPKGLRALPDRLNALFFRFGCSAIMCVSEDIKRQVRLLSKNRQAPFVDFLPLFKADTFATVRTAPIEARPFRVMYLGRIERTKGVFDVLSIARALQDEGRTDVVFELCGTGSALGELRERIKELKLEQVLILRGWCDQQAVRETFSRCHVVVVPTRTDFVEGFNMVVVESLLAGRPVITSRVCPAVEYVAQAVVVVPPNDIGAYKAEIMRLANDVEAYRKLVERTSGCATRFLRESNGFRTALLSVLRAIEKSTAITSREIPVIE